MRHGKALKTNEDIQNERDRMKYVCSGMFYVVETYSSGKVVAA